METKLELIARKAKEDKRLKFTALAHHLNEEFLMACYRELNQQSAPGIDQMTVQAYGENLAENIRNLVQRMKQNQYRPQPVRRTYIAKVSGGQRALGIPSVSYLGPIKACGRWPRPWKKRGHKPAPRWGDG